MTKKSSPRKKRSEYIHATTISKEMNELIVTINELTGEVTFGSEMTNVYAEVSYERHKGPKILSRIPQKDKWLNFDSGPALTRNFDFICAVDTNTRIINGQKTSVVGVVTLKNNLQLPETRPTWKLDVPFCWHIIGIKSDQPENFGWYAAWEQLGRDGLINPALQVGMIVDSDLGNLGDYNHRRRPYFENDLLPPNLQLIYASADSGQENLVNQALSAADSVSGQVLNAVASGAISSNLEKLENPWYESMRIVRPR